MQKNHQHRHDINLQAKNKDKVDQNIGEGMKVTKTEQRGNHAKT